MKIEQLKAWCNKYSPHPLKAIEFTKPNSKPIIVYKNGQYWQVLEGITPKSLFFSNHKLSAN